MKSADAIFKRLIKGKRVVFVGACPNLKNKKMGDLIDSFDTVVRTNGSITLIENAVFARDYGKRIDILYTNNQFYREMRPLPLNEYRRKGVQVMCMKRIMKRDELYYPKVIPYRMIHDTIRAVAKGLPSATMGAFIYTDILAKGPAELHIMGVDFFVSRKPKFEHDCYREYVDGYLPDRIREQGNRINVGKKEDAHNFLGNAKYQFELFNQYKGIVQMPQQQWDLLHGIVEGRIKQGDIQW
jgi:hypothetical protein